MSEILLSIKIAKISDHAQMSKMQNIFDHSRKFLIFDELEQNCLLVFDKTNMNFTKEMRDGK
ncbi:hypothetical protein CMO83_01100 [Candidatus Woesearchaeota archaeon]|jgi:hypothetical protein|nr:hypothetical protein [Candidatus Woesearchaeota archaeon]|tara:strand:+ start:33377 stop:33562 length:186 start_codon:yes stop_codon:yes gene_type:complete